MDCRDYYANAENWYESFDSHRMEVSVIVYTENDEEEYITFPAMYEVCPLCNGKGTHVNPSIDGHGLTADDFYDDPDFADEYFNGLYDVSCYQCKGNRVVPRINESMVDDSLKETLVRFKAQLVEQSQSDQAWEAEIEAELMMSGCW